jgi:hypothetical protein
MPALDPKVIQLLKDVREYTRRERADENVGNPKMVELWMSICKNSRAKAVKELVDFYER